MHGQYEDFCKCAEAVIEAVNLHISDIHPETYLKLLVDYCNVIQRIDANKYCRIKKYVFDLCSKHPALKHGLDRFRSHM